MSVRWTPSLAVGIETLDEQHRELFRRTAAFLDGLEGRTRQDVGILLSYLRTYALTHFGEEEEAMRDAEYPGYERHKRQHDAFLRDLVAYSREQERRRGAGVPPEQLGRWVREWLVEHIRRTDQEMARYLIHRERDLGPPPR